MNVPPGVRAEVGEALRTLGLATRIVREQGVGGGCIHHGTRIETDPFATYFLKWNTSVPAGMFEAEAEGLRALRAAGSIRAPEPLAWSDASGPGWLLLEYVRSGQPIGATQERLGRRMAALHASTSASTFGWSRDNWIGSLEQSNTPSASWADFWRERRIAPQLERAQRSGHLSATKSSELLECLLELIPDALAEVTHPELVHGDLWRGNWLVGEDGEPALIDPAVYRGHGEVDLAMSELFGGFDRAFYEAYDAAHGIPAEYSAYRRDLYQLYYLLVHVNLFGAAYEAGTVAAARRVVRALSG